MRFIGAKSLLLKNIEEVIHENIGGEDLIFCDAFAGTGVVGRYFKRQYQVISNDILYFSYVLQKASIENNILPKFNTLSTIGINDPLSFLENATINYASLNNGEYFITNNYSPYNKCLRMYFNVENANRIDFIRITIEQWRKKALISDQEYFFLLASLILGVPSVSNITGTYGAYLKHWDKRALQKFKLSSPILLNNNKINRSFNKDTGLLLDSIGGDILYLDPPYNSRQYAPNYHILETIARYDIPEIKGVTGMRPYDELKSSFCVKSKAGDSLQALLQKADFSNILLSYSSDGIIPLQDIERIMKGVGAADSYKQYEMSYRQYKSKNYSSSNNLKEYIFYIKKNRISQIELISKQINKKTYLKGPFNYIGGKFKLLNQILPKFPTNINTFVDLFAGGGSIGLNVNANRIVCNDLNYKVIEIFKIFQKLPSNEVLRRIYNIINIYGLSKTNKDGFLRLRANYNEEPDPIKLYVLTTFSFNYQIRFNSNMEYNNPFGANRSYFSANMEKNLLDCLNALKSKNIIFTSEDFTKLNVLNLVKNDFIYCDPPYLISTGSYNDGNRGFKDWTLREEVQLLNLLDLVNSRGIKFALSNVSYHKGKINETLLEWSKKYKLIDLDYSYSNSSHNTSRKSSNEVLIVNYKI